MKIIYQKFGNLSEACLEIKDKVIVIGRNRAGKTMLTLGIEFLKNLVEGSIKGKLFPSNKDVYDLIPVREKHLEISFENYNVKFGEFDLEYKLIEEFSEIVKRSGSLLKIKDKEFKIDENQSFLWYMKDPYSEIGKKLQKYEELAKICSFLDKTYVLRPNEDRIKDSGWVWEKKELIEDGSNLISFLHHLYLSNIEKFDDIRAIMIEVFEIDDLKFEIINHKMLLKSLKNGKEIDIRRESDGFLRFLFYTTALETIEGFIVIEEPEIHMHVGLLDILCEIIKEAPAKVLITTHNPFVLKYFKTEEILGISEGKILKFKEEVEVKEFLERERLLLYAT